MSDEKGNADNVIELHSFARDVPGRPLEEWLNAERKDIEEMVKAWEATVRSLRNGKPENKA